MFIKLRESESCGGGEVYVNSRYIVSFTESKGQYGDIDIYVQVTNHINALKYTGGDANKLLQIIGEDRVKVNGFIDTDNH